MPTVEVFTFGGGQYLLAVFNAVAAWTSSSGYGSMIQVAMVLGLIFSTMIVAFNMNWRAWLQWFLTATLIYMGLMVPKVEVVITDRVQSSVPIGAVSNVPLGLGVLAGFTSQISDYLTRGAELVFGLPDDLRYSDSGMIYGARLYQATQHLRIRDPEFATNLDEHFRQCVYYDVLLGLKSLDTLANAPDLWAAVGPGSPARSQKFLTRNADGTVSSNIITCRDAYSSLNLQWATMIDELAGPFARNLYPGMTEALARSKLLAELPIAYEWLVGVSSDATSIFRQNLAMNAMEQAMYSMAGSTGSAALDVYATTRMQTQTRNTYAMIGENAMKWVPLLHVVLTVLFYAMFPILFPVFLLPYGGVGALRSYAFGFFYLAAWGPLFVVLNMLLMWKARDEGISAIGGSGGVTLWSFSGMQDITADVGILAGYLIASVPFLAAGIARGAMAISGQATSFLYPSQMAATQAGVEASTGSFSLGSTSFDTHASANRQVAQWSLQPQYVDGFARQSTVGFDGSMTTRFGSGNPVVDQSSAISRMAFTPQLTQELQAGFQQSAAESMARGYSLSNSAQEAFGTAFRQFQDFRRTVSQGDTLESSFGTSEADTIRRTLGMLSQASETLQTRFGLSAEEADRRVLDTALRGSVHASAWLQGPGGGGGGSEGGGAAIKPWGARAGLSVDQSVTGSRALSGTTSASRQADSADQFLQQLAESQDWATSMDAFRRASVGSSRQDISAAASGMSSSFERTNTLTRQAVESFERARRYEEAATLRDSSGVSMAENVTQEFVEYVLREQSKMPGGIGGFAWNPTRGLPRTPEETREKDFWVGTFFREKAARIAAGVEDRLVRPTPAGIMAPSANTQVSIDRLSRQNSARVPASPDGETAVPIPEPEDLRRQARRTDLEVEVSQGMKSARLRGKGESADDLRTHVQSGDIHAIGGRAERPSRDRFGR